MDPPCFGTFQYTFHLLRLCLGFADQSKIINFSPMDLILRLFHALPISSESCSLRGLRCVFRSLETGGWWLGNILLMTWARIHKSFSGGWFMIGFTTSNGSGSKFKDKEFRLNDDFFLIIQFEGRLPIFTHTLFGLPWIYLDILINCFDGTGLPCHQNWSSQTGKSDPTWTFFLNSTYLHGKEQMAGLQRYPNGFYAPSPTDSAGSKTSISWCPHQ